MVMDISIDGTVCDKFQYMINHSNSLVSQESIMASSSLLPSSYLTLQENVREIIKIEDMVPISSNDSHFLSNTTEDSKDVYPFDGGDYMSDEPEICSTLFSLKTHPILHQRSEKPYQCDKCDKRFTMKRYLKQHQTTHSNEKPFKCDKCGKQFSQKSYLKRHQILHTGEKAFKCDVCDKKIFAK